MAKPKGSCLCGTVPFQVEGPIRGVGQCHCSKCRKVAGTNGNAVFFVPSSRFEWLEKAYATRDRCNVGTVSWVGMVPK